MVRGRLWRLLMIFFIAYLLFLLYFFRTFDSDTNKSTTSPPSHAQIQIIEAKNESIEVPKVIVIRSVEDNLSNLEPVLTKGVLGNYEPKNLLKSSGPGEDGAGIQLQGDEEKKLGEQSVAEYGFNEVVSGKISLDRRARDTR